jgi:y4mF family transcriptional regulator
MRKDSGVSETLTLPASIRTVAEVGDIVESVRKEQGLTQMDASGLSGLGIRFMVDLEKGKETIQMQKVLDVLTQLGLEIIIRKKGL